VRAAIVDVGSNTIRLLVVRRQGDTTTTVREARAYVGLGEKLAGTGSIADEKIAEAGRVVAEQTAFAREAGATAIEVVVTAPGREVESGRQLLSELRRAVPVPVRVRVLSAGEEAALAFAGAVISTACVASRFIVCDVGGGSTELAAGTRATGAGWSRSVALGSLRLTATALRNDPPEGSDIAVGRLQTAIALRDVDLPSAEVALAAGGTARPLSRLVGARLAETQLNEALTLLASEPSRVLAARFGFAVWRARTLAAGAAILAEVERALGLPLEVVSGGVRDGAALALLDRM
jgi:exopolyphosphatase/guanosine-5'-triphosphate,3'-diphosphate pyrophosphatase